MSDAPLPEPKPVLTANSIAKEFFVADLQSHEEDKSGQSTDALVIFHDSCYGHRFSRPNSTTNILSSIVERPERLKACALGVAAAYVKLGERHADGRHALHPRLDPASIPNLPFRIRKVSRRLSLLSAAVVAVHGKEWMEELKSMCQSTRAKLAANELEVKRCNSNLRPGQEPKPQFNQGDLYLGPESLEAMEGALGAVCEAVDAVFTSGHRRCFVSIRPPGHHCSGDYPSGFCWVNNVHVGIAHAMMNHGLTHAAIVDFDLHHGDGSQAIAWSHNHRHTYGKGRGGLSQWKKSAIGYFSLHDINSFPCEMGNAEKVTNASLCIENAHGQNIWNIHLQPWDTEPEFWALYENRYSVLIRKAESFLKAQTAKLRNANKPAKSAIFISAGFDASEWESAGMQRHSVMVPTDFYARITRDVVEMASDPETATDGRIISVMEGGYSDRAICSGVFSHLSGMVATQTGNDAKYLNAVKEEIDEDVAPDCMAPHGLLSQSRKRTFSSSFSFDPAWWSSTALDKLERAVAAPTPFAKKPRHAVPPTYSSPTHASTAKAVDPINLRRSLSGLNGSFSRPPTPPPPEVPWTIATQELYRLLVPEDRPTESCTIEEIGSIVAQAKQDYPVSPPPEVAREIQLPTPPNGPTRAGLRDRRAKPIEAIHEEESVDKPTKGRRKTTAHGYGLVIFFFLFPFQHPYIYMTETNRSCSPLPELAPLNLLNRSVALAGALAPRLCSQPPPKTN